MNDERQHDIIMGLVLTYNVVGLMLNNVSQYIHEKLYFTHCTGSSMYICPNPLERSADIFVRTIETGVYTFNL